MCVCVALYKHCQSRTHVYISAQWRIQGGDRGVRTPPSASTSLINQSTYDSLHDTAQLALGPSEKTITGVASSIGGRLNE